MSLSPISEWCNCKVPGPVSGCPQEAFEAELRDAFCGPRIITASQEGGLASVLTFNWHETVAFGRIPIYIEMNAWFPATWSPVKGDGHHSKGLALHNVDW